MKSILSLKKIKNDFYIFNCCFGAILICFLCVFREGKDVVLRKDESPRYGNNYSRSTRGKKNNNPKHDDSTTKVDNDGDDEDKNVVKEKGDVKRRATRRRQPRKQQQTQQKDTNDENSPEAEVNNSYFIIYFHLFYRVLLNLSVFFHR